VRGPRLRGRQPRATDTTQVPSTAQAQTREMGTAASTPRVTKVLILVTAVVGVVLSGCGAVTTAGPASGDGDGSVVASGGSCRVVDATDGTDEIPTWRSGAAALAAADALGAAAEQHFGSVTKQDPLRQLRRGLIGVAIGDRAWHPDASKTSFTYELDPYDSRWHVVFPQSAQAVGDALAARLGRFADVTYAQDGGGQRL